MASEPGEVHRQKAATAATGAADALQMHAFPYSILFIWLWIHKFISIWGPKSVFCACSLLPTSFAGDSHSRPHHYLHWYLIYSRDLSTPPVTGRQASSNPWISLKSLRITLDKSSLRKSKRGSISQAGMEDKSSSSIHRCDQTVKFLPFQSCIRTSS